MIKLFIDDIRTAPPGWVCARTITAAIRILYDFKVSDVSLDHDIVFVDERGQFTGRVHEENFSAVARFIADMAPDVRPKRVTIHTANPLGREALRQILDGKVDELTVDHTNAAQWATDPICRAVKNGEVPADEGSSEGSDL